MLFVTALAYGATLLSVTTRDYYEVAARIVIQVDKNAKYSVESNASAAGCEIRIYDTQTSVSKVQYQNPLVLISNIQIANKTGYSSVMIDTKGACKILNFAMEDPYRVVVDLIKFPVTAERQERLGLARFYDDTQRYRHAGSLYSKLAVDYADDAEINYLWATLLYRVGNPDKAAKRAGMIPAGSSYYKYAQSLLDRIERRVAPDAEPLEEPQAVSEQDSTTVQDTVAAVTSGPQTAQESSRSKLGVYILVFLAFCAGVATVYGSVKLLRTLSRKTMRTDETASEPEANPTELNLEDGIKARMVTKLMSDGWTTKEIARELQISRKDVERFANNKSLRDIT
jgi:hypothetical protein